MKRSYLYNRCRTICNVGIAACTMSAVFSFSAVASAHVVVTPARAGVGQELTFNISVPNERQSAVTSLKLLIPSGVSDVTPTVTAGWTITPTSNNNANDPETGALTWTGSTIPVGQREDFSFSAQVPASATKLAWKAYQTYADGTTVHWDQTPAGSDDSSGDAGPYSVTAVANDLVAKPAPAAAAAKPSMTLPIVLSVLALAVSIASFLLRWRK